MIIYPTFDRSIRLHIQFFDEKFSADQFVFILPISFCDLVYMTIKIPGTLHKFIPMLHILSHIAYRE